ncbi:MAG: SIMPL domain-containing protein [Cognaticolwellia sp.]
MLNTPLKFLVLLSLSLCITAESAELVVPVLPNSIQVTGFGESYVSTSDYSLRVTISERGVSAEKTQQLVEHKAMLLRSFIEKNVGSVTLVEAYKPSLQVIYPKLNDNSAEVEFLTRLPNKKIAKINSQQSTAIARRFGPKIAVSASMDVDISQLSHYQAFIDQLVKIGVSEVLPMTVSKANYQRAYQQALKNAIKDGKDKAEKMLAMTGASLGKIIAVQEISPQQFNPLSNTQFSAEKMINAQVNLIFVMNGQ